MEEKLADSSTNAIGDTLITNQFEEFSIFDKNDLEKKLLCIICDKPLNIPPIIYFENLGNVCGRCSGSTSQNGFGAVFRQHLYEELLHNMTFPCANKNYGCLQVLKYEEVKDHEKSCRFQCADCPFSYKSLFPDKNCTWVGKTKVIQEHLQVHKEEFLDPPQFVWPENCNKLFLTTVGSQVVTCVIKYDKDCKYQCLLMVNGTDLESQCFRYQLELFNEEKTNSIILRRHRLEPLGNCDEHLRNPEKLLEVDLATIRNMLQIPPSANVIGKFGIVKKNKKEIIQLTSHQDKTILDECTSVGPTLITKEKIGPSDEEFLNELECPVCNEYMVPPIFICPTGHSVCGDCKVNVTTCPTCRCPLGDGRNWTLEKVTTCVRYPCRNRDIGCGFVSTSDKIKLHQTTCELSENKCIMNCGWKGLGPAMYNHMLEKHISALLEHNVPILKDIKSDKNTGHYFFYVMGTLFCMSFKNCGKFTVKFNVMHVMHVDDPPLFKYKIEFFNNPKATSSAISITNNCQKWNDNLSEALTNCVTIPGDLLKPVTFENSKYYFRVNITKV